MVGVRKDAEHAVESRQVLLQLQLTYWLVDVSLNVWLYRQSTRRVVSSIQVRVALLMSSCWAQRSAKINKMQKKNNPELDLKSGIQYDRLVVQHRRI